MKTKAIGLMALILLSVSQCFAQKKITVEAQSNDISNNLDLQAVASIFGEAKNLEDFERRLNDYDSQVSNLDLNNDGEVDYLRVIETTENNVHLVLIQAVLAKDVFQDVASIVVERNNYRRTYVQVVGDPYLYGDNYIIEPTYVYTPLIFGFFWGSGYHSWISPYYWGYYPRYYRPYHSCMMDRYMTHIHNQINHNHRYYYSEHIRNSRAEHMHRSISRVDYSSQHPDRSFSVRNSSVNARNKYDFDRNQSNQTLRTRPSYNSNSTSRGTETRDQVGSSRGSQTGNRTSGTVNTETRTSGTINTESRTSNSGSRTSVTSKNTETRASNNDNSGSRTVTKSTDSGSRTSGTSNNGSNSRTSSPSVSQPARSVETRAVERSSSSRTTSPSSQPARETRSSSSDNGSKDRSSGGNSGGRR